MVEIINHGNDTLKMFAPDTKPAQVFAHTISGI